MVPKNYEPRAGDVVTLSGTICFDFDLTDDNRVFVKINGDEVGRRIRVPLDKIIGVKHRVWNVDEEVQHKANPKIYGNVVAISGDAVWVKLNLGSEMKGSSQGHRVFHCNELVPFGDEVDLPVANHEPFPETEAND